MHHRGAANLDLALDVEANELFEARRGPVETDPKHGPTPFQDGREKRFSAILPDSWPYPIGRNSVEGLL